MSEIPREPPATDDPRVAAPLPLAVRVEGDKGLLVMGPKRMFGWLGVGELRLSIPDPRFPLDAGGGAVRFQRRRLRVASARFELDELGLAALVRERAPFLAAAGFDDVQLALCDGFVEVGCRARVADRVVDLTGRILALPEGQLVRAMIVDARLLGPARSPAPLVAHNLLVALTGTPQICGPADVLVDPLTEFLWRALPPAGWRLPDPSGVHVVALELARGVAAICHAPGATEPPSVVATHPALREADSRLVAGDLRGAAIGYRAALGAAGGDARPIVERLLQVLVAREGAEAEAESLAREALARWPDFAPAEVALGVVAAERGRDAEAAHHFARAAVLAEEQGREEESVRAALVAARRLRTLDPAQATALCERIVAKRPGHAEATEALADQLATEGRWSDLVRILKRRVDTIEAPREKGLGHLAIGELLLGRLFDAAAAREELLCAVRFASEDARTWDALARAHLALGDHQAAIRTLDHVAQLHEERGNPAAEARTHARVAELWETLGDDANAHLRCRRALELAPDDLDLLEHLAGVATRRGRPDEAIAAMARLADLCSDGDRRRHADRELGRLLLAKGDPTAARIPLGRAAEDPTPDPGALVLLGDVKAAEGDHAGAATLYERAATMLVGTDAAEVALRLGRVLLLLGRDRDADGALEEAFRLDPEGGPGWEAASELATRARAIGDLATEARWLDALLAVHDGDEVKAAFALRRAELFVAAGQAGAARPLLDHAIRCLADRRAARRVYAEVLRAEGDPWARADMLEALAAESDDAAERAEALAAAAGARLEVGDAAAALASARLAAALAPLDPFARRILGEAAWQAESWQDVVTAYHGVVSAAGTLNSLEDARRLGLALLECGRDADAVLALRAVTTAPAARGEPLANAFRLLAEIHERCGDHRTAAELCSQAAIDPRTDGRPSERAELHFRAAELLRQRLGSPPEAIRELEAALRADPHHLPSLDALEGIFQEAGDLEHVAVTLEKKVKAMEQHPARQKALLVRLGEAELLLGHPDGAREAFQRALGLDPHYRPALRRLAPDLLAQGDTATASELWTRLLAAPAPTADDDVLDARGDERANAHIALARIDLARGRRAEADGHLTAAIALVPAHARLLAELGTLAEALARWGDLETLLRRRAELEPDPAVRRGLEERRARLLLEELGEPLRALEVVGGLIVEGPAESDLVALENDCERALDQLGQSTHESPRAAASDHSAALARARELEATDPAGALSCLACWSRASASIELLELRSDLFEEAGRFPDAAADLGELRRRAEATSDRVAERRVARRLAVLSFERLHDEWAAAALFRRALELDPEDVAAAEALATLAERREDDTEIDRALELLVTVARRALAGPAAEAEALCRLAGRARGRGDLARAAELTDEALAIAPRDPRALRDRATVAAERGDEDGGARFLHKLAGTLEATPERRDVVLGERRPSGVTGDPREVDPDDAERLVAALMTHVQNRDEPGKRRLARDEHAQDLLARLRRATEATGRVAPLADALEIVAHHEADPVDASLAFAELAEARLRQADPRRAADALLAALAHCPDDASLLARVEPLLRDENDLWRLLHAVELHLPTTRGETRAIALKMHARLMADALGEPARAAEALTLALAADPTVVEVLLEVADFHWLDGATGQAEECYLRALAARSVPEDRKADVHARCGLAAEKRGESVEALAHFRLALEASSACGPAWSGIERALRTRGDFRAVVDLLVARAAAVADPDDRARSLAEAAALLSGPLGAPEEIRRLGALAPGKRWPKRARTLPEENDTSHLEALLAMSRRAGDHARSAELLDRMIDTTAPGPARARFWLERSLILSDHLDRIGEAHRCLEAAFAEAPDDPSAAYELRRTATSRGEWALVAELLYREIAGTCDAQAKAARHRELAALLEQRLDDVDAAIRNHESALALDPLAADSRTLARLYLAKGRCGEAAMATETTAEREPDARLRATRLIEAADLFRRAGNQYDASRLAERAAGAYRTLVEERPDDLVAWEALASTADRGGDTTAAIAALRELLLRAADASPAARARWNAWLGALWQRAGDLAASARCLEEAAADVPTDPLLADLVELYAQLGEWARSAETLSRLVDVVGDPVRRAALLYRRGELCRLRLGDESGATAAYERAIALDPGHVATLRRLVDRTWAEDNTARLLAIAARLDEAQALASPETAPEAWARFGVVAALEGNTLLAGRMAEALGAGRAGALAAAVADLAARRPGAMGRLVAATRLLCAPPGPPLDAVRAVLSARGTVDPPARELAERLG